MIDKSKKLYIAGHQGMVGSSLLRKFKAENFENIVMKSFNELDLRRQYEVEKFFAKDMPSYVIIAAAKVGGILANNTYRADFIYDNLMIESNIIHAAYKFGCEKLIFLGSSCIYPKNAPQPLKEEYLLSGYLETTNEPYAIAKIAGIKLCESYYMQYGCNFFSVMPTNMYGPNDNFDPTTSHVLPALIKKFHDASSARNRIAVTQDSPQGEQNSVIVWGTGAPRREFLYVDDLADALFFLLNNINGKDIYDKRITHLNIGTGVDCTIAELAEIIKRITGFDGEIVYDTSKPDGTQQKLLEINRIKGLGWKHSISLEEGIRKTYESYVQSIKTKIRSGN